jgi:hypothetical protein
MNIPGSCYDSQFVTLTLDISKWSASCSGYFIPREIAPDIHWIVGTVGPLAGLDATERRIISYRCRDSNSNSSVGHPLVRRPILIVGSYCNSICFVL